MAITLGAITLPGDLVWQDEFNWSPVQQSEERGLTGALIVQTGVKSAGRPITLGGGRHRVWIDRAALAVLYASVANNAAMTLTLHDNRTFTVRWRNSEQPIDAEQVAGIADAGAGDFYYLTLRFLTVA